MGRNYCLSCPVGRWDYEAKDVRPEPPRILGWLKNMLGLVQMGHLPRAGGALQQDPQLMELLGLVAENGGS